MPTTTRPSFETRREQRLAETLARRGTPEWRADGAALVAAREEERREAARRYAAERLAERRAEDARRPVSDRELDRAIRTVEAAIREAAADTGLDEHVVAHDVVAAVSLDFRPALAAEVRRVVL